MQLINSTQNPSETVKRAPVFVTHVVSQRGLCDSDTVQFCCPALFLAGQ